MVSNPSLLAHWNGITLSGKWIGNRSRKGRHSVDCFTHVGCNITASGCWTDAITLLTNPSNWQYRSSKNPSGGHFPRQEVTPERPSFLDVGLLQLAVRRILSKLTLMQSNQLINLLSCFMQLTLVSLICIVHNLVVHHFIPCQMFLPVCGCSTVPPWQVVMYV